MIKENKKGQVTIFIILAIVILAAVGGYFLLRGSFTSSIPSDLRPVYDYYTSCLEQTTNEGIALLGEQGGYIKMPEFESGSSYMPFSSQLNFFGQPVPYWMYVSGNNILKEQVPTKQDMNEELETYIEDRLTNCDFSDFELGGYDIYVDKGSVSVDIDKMKVDVTVNNRITIFKGEQSAIVSSHDVNIKSKLGKFYDMAMEVYDYEKSEMFLEKYA